MTTFVGPAVDEFIHSAADGPAIALEWLREERVHEGVAAGVEWEDEHQHELGLVQGYY